MGLHNTAHYLKSKGRGEDTELVHMTKGEVKGLQELALANGGTLTINPDTGLVEAGFLSKMLPTVAGIAAGAMTANPMIGAAVAGGLTMATGGSLTQGLLAGVGAYGGAGAFGSLAEAGATQLAAEGAAEATQQAALQAGQSTAQAAQAASATVDPIAAMNASQGWTGAAQTLPGDFATQAMGNYGPGIAESNVINNMPNLTTEQAAALKGQLGQTGNLYSPVETAGRLNATANLSPVDAAGAGIKSAFSSPSSTMDFINQNKMNLAMMAAPAFMGDGTQPQGAVIPPTESGSYLPRISPNFQGYVQPQPTTYYQAQYPDYRKKPYAGGGIVAMATGGMATGPVEQMTQNMMGGQDNMYPQSQQEHTNFATPTQMPASAEVINSDYDTKTDPYRGITMSGGGQPAAYLPKGDAGVFKDTDPDTSRQDAYTAALTRLKKVKGAANIKGLPALAAAAEPLGTVNMAEGGDAGAAATAVSGIPGAANVPGLADLEGLYANMVSGYSQPQSGIVPQAPVSFTPAALSYRPDTSSQATLLSAVAPSVAKQEADAKAKAEQDSMLGMDDEAFQQWRLSRDRQEYQNSLNNYGNYGGGAAGGIMPESLRYAAGGSTGQYNLGSYSDGGRLLKGPGDGMSDNIPAMIGRKQPARLADGEFVVPADVVSHLGNGSTDAGAKKLYAMMDKIRQARTGKKKQAPAVKANKFIPA